MILICLIIFFVQKYLVEDSKVETKMEDDGEDDQEDDASQDYSPGFESEEDIKKEEKEEGRLVFRFWNNSSWFHSPFYCWLSLQFSSTYNSVKTSMYIFHK